MLFGKEKNLRYSASIIIDVFIYIFFLSEKKLDVRFVDFVFFLVFVSLAGGKLRRR